MHDYLRMSNLITCKNPIVFKEDVVWNKSLFVQEAPKHLCTIRKRHRFYIGWCHVMLWHMYNTRGTIPTQDYLQIWPASSSELSLWSMKPIHSAERKIRHQLLCLGLGVIRYFENDINSNWNEVNRKLRFCGVWGGDFFIYF